MDSELVMPNEFDRKRVERALRNRARYKYVSPKVRAVPDGLRIESPCCSRRIEPGGGTVDIALLQFLRKGGWKLYCKDHSAGEWKLYGKYEQLTDLLEPLTADPKRMFWQ
jgi:Protein of unknown function (DUF3024)